jgi:superfamily I DNA/RNA helicase
MSKFDLEQKRLVMKAVKTAMSSTNEDDEKLRAEEFIGLLTFFLALDTCIRLYDQGMYSPDKKTNVEAHLTDGLTFARRKRDELEIALKDYLAEYAEKLRFRTLYRRLSQGRKVDLFVQRLGELIEGLLPRLMRDMQVVQDMFKGRSLMMIRQLRSAMEETGLLARLHKLAAMPPAPGRPREYRWITKASQYFDVPVDELEMLVSQAEQAKDLGEQLQIVKSRLASLDPSTPEAVDLEEEKQALLEMLNDTIEQSSNPTILKSIAVDSATKPQKQREHATEIGRSIGLSEEQEEALLVRGKAIIAAGAGSGKTATLAGKIVYHVKDLGVKPSEIIACSFTRKSSEELKRRVTKYGVDVMDPRSQDSFGFGTTHSIAGRILREYGGIEVYGDNILKDSDCLNLLKLAIWQTMMLPEIGKEHPELDLKDLTFFPNLPGQKTSPTLDDIANDSDEKKRLDEFKKSLDAIQGYTQYSVDKYMGGRPQPWAKANFAIVERYRGVDPITLSPKEKAVLNAIYAKDAMKGQLKWKGIPNYRLSQKLGAKSILSPKDLKFLEWKYAYHFKTPANQWFNLGLRNKDFMRGVGDKAEPIPKGEISLFIDNQKGRLRAPGKVAKDAVGGDLKGYLDGVDDSGELIGEGTDRGLFVKSAVYGAYQWLLNNTEEFKGKYNATDALLKACQFLVENPDKLRQVQKRFKAVFIDEAQDLNECVSIDTQVQVKGKGTITMEDLSIGDEILSYDNGLVVYNEVLDKGTSHWTRGYKITTKSGKTLSMSPSHQIYATQLDELPEGKLALYLMYRNDLGFRIGTTSCPWRTSAGRGGRIRGEKADCMWILDIGDEDEILYKEQEYSLKFAVPTYLFEGGIRGCDQGRINRIFAEFGQNGFKILDHFDLKVSMPHWTSTSYLASGRKVITFNVHNIKKSSSAAGSKMWLNWGSEKPDGLEDLPVYEDGKGNFFTSKLLSSYEEARNAAYSLKENTGAFLIEYLTFQGEKLFMHTASSLKPGMKVLTRRSGVDLSTSDLLPIAEYLEISKELGVDISELGGAYNTGKEEIHEYLRSLQLLKGVENPLAPIKGSHLELDEIESVEKITDQSFVDITVARSSNFFGNNILSHNCQHLLFGLATGTYDALTQQPNGQKGTADTYCLIGDDKQAIYAWRGADPNEFIEKSDSYSEKGDFQTKLLTTNYRSGNAIVQAANNLIAHNEKQIKMVCKANVSRKGEGRIDEVVLSSMNACADYVADMIKDRMRHEEEGLTYNNFGVACRTGREINYFIQALIQEGIPFRSKRHPFKGPAIKGLVHVLGIMSPEGRSLSEMNEHVLAACKTPDFGLNPNTVLDKIEKKVGKNPDVYRFLVEENGWQDLYGRSGEFHEKMKAYANFLETIYGQAESLGPEGALSFILNYKGPYGSLVDTLVEDLKSKPDELEAVLAENMDSDLSDEDLLRDYALQPIDPLKTALLHFGNVKDALDYVATVIQKSEALAKPDDPSKTGYNDPAVSLDTIHGWKGLEAKHVFVPMYESKVGGFPHARSSDSAELMESERRLAYVAITRGEDSVTILRPETNPVSENFPVERSRFLDEACIPDPDERRSKKASMGVSAAARLPEDLLDYVLKGDFDSFMDGLDYYQYISGEGEES